MIRSEAISKYRGKISPEILYSYSPHDESFTVNDNDPDLDLVTLLLPEPPDWALIDGWGLPAKDQKFKKAVYPARLKELEERCAKGIKESRTSVKNEVVTVQRIIDELWKQLDLRQSEYRDEIKWIEHQWYFILNGYWCFINGKPTYIDGFHYMFQNFWDLTDAKTEYRDRDRRFFHFQRYALTSTEDQFGNEMGHRTIFGTTYPKHRRDGATHKFLAMGYTIIINTIGSLIFGIQSFDDDNAREHYTGKLLPAFKSMPFFLKPIWKGPQAPQAELSFTRIDNNIGQELGSKIKFATTASRKYFDGKKLKFVSLEEEGKTLSEDIFQRWAVIKQTLAQGSGSSIHGFACHPTTVADMDEGGGRNFYKLNNESRFYERNPKSGQTKSGLIRLFIPAIDGLENFIGPYGESVIDTPTPEQAAYIQRDIGAREYIQSQLDEYVRIGTPDAMKSYRDLKRLFPLSYADCFRTAEGDTGFDVEKLDLAIDRLRRESLDEFNQPTVRGDFRYIIPNEPNPISSKEYLERELYRIHVSPRVEWFPNKDGLWEISERLEPGRSNLKYYTDGEYYPMHPFKYTSGADPFQFLDKSNAQKREDSSRLSKGGLTVFKERDAEIDPDHKDITQWITHRFVCTYENRPESDDEFAEDSLMTCIYFGAEMYCEQNIKLIWKHFVKRKHSGYLKYKIDETTGKPREFPGFYSLTASKQELFGAIKTYIKWHIHREKHLKLVEQFRSIRGVEYMTDYDLLTAGGAALLGSQIVRYEIDSSQEKDEVEVGGVMPQFEYN